jgi:3'-phosphoadenosine 5'-phosphosulfate sulfotransferase (PAPS reductase)/FAD synthetase
MTSTDFKNVALQFSGGKDSLTCVYLLEDHLDEVTIYHLDTGDQPEETRETVEAVKAWAPRFVTIQADSKAWRRVNGNPSDVVPASAHLLGTAYGLSKQRLSNRFDCCFHNLMLPMHQRMVADGVDCVIRGTKLCDTGAVPQEGPTPFYHIELPLRNWSHDEVFAYLKTKNAKISDVYEHVRHTSPECVTCTAWWDDKKSAYLKAKHPQVFKEYQVALSSIRESLRSHLADLDSELAA